MAVQVERKEISCILNWTFDNTWIRVTWLSISHTVTSRVLRSSSVNSFISCCWDCMYYEKGGMQWSKYKEDNSYWGEDMSFTFVWLALTCEILFLPREHKIHIFKLTSNVLFIISHWYRRFWRFSEGHRRLPKTFDEDTKMFRCSVKSWISSLVRIWKMRHLSSGCSFVWILRVVYFPALLSQEVRVYISKAHKGTFKIKQFNWYEYASWKPTRLCRLLNARFPCSFMTYFSREASFSY